MGKKSRRREKKPKEMKSEIERKVEMDLIKEKLTSLGLSEEMEGIDTFYKIAKEFIKTGNSWSGKVKITGHKRIMDIICTPYKHKESKAALLYNKDI